jgi:integrase
MRLFDPQAVPTPRQVHGWKKRRRSEVTAGELVDRYLKWCDVREVHDAGSRSQVNRYLAQFVKLYGCLPVIQLRPFQLTNWIDANPAWKKSNTRRAVAARVRSVFNWAVEQQYIRRNPFKPVHYAEGERAPEMTDDVWAKLCKLANKPYERVLRFLRYTGCREGELCEAVWGGINFETGTWVILKHKTRKRTRKPKVVTLTRRALEFLKEIRPDDPKPGDRVFLNTWGKPWNPKWVQIQLVRLKEKLGTDCPATIHGIRHRFATAAVANGAPMELVAQQLGNDPATCGKYYVDLSREAAAIRAAAELGMPRE